MSAILDARRYFFLTFPNEKSSSSSMTRRLTSEQRRIVNMRVTRSDVVKVNAFAGSGKTTTLVEFAKHRPGKRLLYLVFNVAVREHAESIFPENTVVRSVHKMAFAKIGRRYAHKLKAELKIPLVLNCLRRRRRDETGISPEFVNLVVNTLKTFFLSSSKTIDQDHLPNSARRIVPKVMECANFVWSLMKNREDKDLPMTHNGYLKLYHLLRPKLHQTYDIIMLDEAQDTNEVIRDLVLSQKCGKVIVGDRHQGIYSFIGATDALDRVRATKTMRLTACFRFHDEIARVANALLALNTDETQRLVGMNTPYNYKSSRIEMGRSRNRSRKYFTQKKN